MSTLLKYMYWLYILAWILLFFTYLNPQLNTYIRSLGFGISIASIILLTLTFIKELVLT